jgi:hypothetical protein
MGSDQENKAGVEEHPSSTVVSDAELWLLCQLSHYRVGLWHCPNVLGFWYALHGAIGTQKMNSNKLHSQ